MKTILQSLTEVVSHAFDACGYERMLGKVSFSDRADLCRLQCNGALAAAKIYKKPPMTIAEEVAAYLRQGTVFEKAEAYSPGFINLDIKDMFLLEICRDIFESPQTGVPQASFSQTVILDYGGPNVAKPLHIGHLRPAVIGQAFKNLLRAAGHQVISDVHLGDWGLPMGLVIGELECRNITDIQMLTAKALNEIYPAASRRTHEDNGFKIKARNITAALQKKDARYLSIWEKIVEISVEDLRENYKRLRVDFDYWKGESDAQEYIEETLEIIKRGELLQYSEGAWVMETAIPEDRAPMPPAILIKSDGSANYTTTDLATLLQRQRDYMPDAIWYIVDQRQALHFTQVFRCAQKAGLVPSSVQLEHLGFGTMNGKDGKPFKTRDGGVMPLEEFLDAVSVCALVKLNQSEHISPAQKPVIAQKLALAAIKFADMENSMGKDCVFDMDRFLSFEGKTGVYLLYTVTRMHSLLQKCGEAKENRAAPDKIFGAVEREVLWAVAKSSDAFFSAIEDRALHYICDSAYQIACAFSVFYHEKHISTETDPQKKNTWLDLCALTLRSLKKHLEILGIETVEKM